MTKSCTDNGHKEAFDFNVQMYILADFLGIAELQTMATANCKLSLDEANNIGSMAEPICHALSNTKRSDQGLRPQILRFCAARSQQVQDCADLHNALRFAEPIAWHLQVQANIDQSVLTGKIAAYSLELSLLRARLDLSEEGLDESNSRYSIAVRLVDSYKDCRNCERVFGARLDVSEPRVLRCSKCRCKHPWMG